MNHPATDKRVREAQLSRLRATHKLLRDVQQEHARAFEAALKACSLAEMARTLGMSRSGIAHHRDLLKRGGRTSGPRR